MDTTQQAHEISRSNPFWPPFARNLEVPSMIGRLAYVTLVWGFAVLATFSVCADDGEFVYLTKRFRPHVDVYNLDDHSMSSFRTNNGHNWGIRYDAGSGSLIIVGERLIERIDLNGNILDSSGPGGTGLVIDGMNELAYVAAARVRAFSIDGGISAIPLDYDPGNPAFSLITAVEYDTRTNTLYVGNNASGGNAGHAIGRLRLDSADPTVEYLVGTSGSYHAGMSIDFDNRYLYFTVTGNSFSPVSRAGTVNRLSLDHFDGTYEEFDAAAYGLLNFWDLRVLGGKLYLLTFERRLDGSSGQRIMRADIGPNGIDFNSLELVLDLGDGNAYNGFDMPGGTRPPGACAVEIEVVCSGGELSAACQDVMFPQVNLDGQDVIVPANSATWTASDTVCPGAAGWHVTLIAQDHLRGFGDPGNRVIFVGENEGFMVECLDTEIVTVSGDAVNLPTCPGGFQSIPLDDGNQVPLTIIYAEPGHGKGVYEFVPHFELLVPGATVPDVYRTNIFVDIMAGVQP